MQRGLQKQTNQKSPAGGFRVRAVQRRCCEESQGSEICVHRSDPLAFGVNEQRGRQAVKLPPPMFNPPEVRCQGCLTHGPVTAAGNSRR